MRLRTCVRGGMHAGISCLICASITSAGFAVVDTEAQHRMNVFLPRYSNARQSERAYGLQLVLVIMSSNCQLN